MILIIRICRFFFLEFIRCCFQDKDRFSDSYEKSPTKKRRSRSPSSSSAGAYSRDEAGRPGSEIKKGDKEGVPKSEKMRDTTLFAQMMKNKNLR